MRWSALLLIIFICSCASVERIGIVRFPDCEIHYVDAETGNPLSGTLRVIDRYKHTYSDNKTVFIQGDSSSKESFANKTFKTIPVPLPVF